MDGKRFYPMEQFKISSSSSPSSSSHHNRDDHRALTYRYPPFFITFISIFELISFLYYALRTEEPISMIGPVPFSSKLIYNPYRRYEAWRYLTYMLIHAGYWHIIFNLLIQLAVGVPLELAHKFDAVFIIYFGGVIGGSLANSILDPHSYLAGASSGCYALIAAHLSNMILNWKELHRPYCRLITLLLFCSIDLGEAIYARHFGRGNMTYRISYGGHLAGAFSGLLLGLVFLKNLKVTHKEEVLSHYAAATYAVLAVSNRADLPETVGLL